MSFFDRFRGRKASAKPATTPRPVRRTSRSDSDASPIPFFPGFDNTDRSSNHDYNNDNSSYGGHSGGYDGGSSGGSDGGGGGGGD